MKDHLGLDTQHVLYTCRYSELYWRVSQFGFWTATPAILRFCVVLSSVSPGKCWYSVLATAVIAGWWSGFEEANFSVLVENTALSTAAHLSLSLHSVVSEICCSFVL